MKAEEKQRLFIFNTYAPSICLTALYRRGCYYTQELTEKQQQKPERLPRDHAPLLLQQSSSEAGGAAVGSPSENAGD